MNAPLQHLDKHEITFFEPGFLRRHWIIKFAGKPDLFDINTAKLYASECQLQANKTLPQNVVLVCLGAYEHYKTYNEIISTGMYREHTPCIGLISESYFFELMQSVSPDKSIQLDKEQTIRDRAEREIKDLQEKEKKTIFLKELLGKGNIVPKLPFSEEPIHFNGSLFVITGEFESLERKEVELIIKSFSGKILNKISSMTNYIIVGNKPAPGWAHGNFGRKIEEALIHKTTFLSETFFLSQVEPNFTS